MTTSYSTRTIPTTNYNLTRIGGEYLVSSEGDYITDSFGNRIIVLVVGGHLPITDYTVRSRIGITYLVNELGDSLTDDNGNLLYASQFDTQYTVRTPI